MRGNINKKIIINGFHMKVFWGAIGAMAVLSEPLYNWKDRKDMSLLYDKIYQNYGTDTEFTKDELERMIERIQRIYDNSEEREFPIVSGYAFEECKETIDYLKNLLKENHDK